MNVDHSTLVAPATSYVPPLAPKLGNLQGKTWLDQATQREVSAPLGALPANISFPEDFPEPIRYDAAGKRLLYRGFMPHATFVELQKLSNDFHYLRALEQLFAASAHVDEPASATTPTWWWLSGVGLVLLLSVVGWVCWR